MIVTLTMVNGMGLLLDVPDGSTQEQVWDLVDAATSPSGAFVSLVTPFVTGHTALAREMILGLTMAAEPPDGVTPLRTYHRPERETK